MKITVKLDPALESALRSRSAALGISASAVVREALQAYLSQTESPTPSASELGATVFGRYACVMGGQPHPPHIRGRAE
jgi:plasmid stability protein